MASLVDKATSDMLIGPDWAMNMEICDIINRDPGAAKDVVKAVKKRLGHRNPKVQLLALTVLETIVKNCGVAVHQQVAEKDVLHEMVKIVKRKTDMHVRDKILVLLSSWQEAFGGPRGRYPQYFMAFEELRRLGVEFPDRPAERDAPIFTPPQTHPLQQPVPGYGSPAHMPSRLEALMNDDLPGLSLTEIETARGRVEVLNDMLNAVNPRDKQAVKDELIVELVEQCRSTQQRVMSLVNNTSDEELLRQGLGLNDDLQKVLEKHDAIAAGKALPKDPLPAPIPLPHNKVSSKPKTESEDDFAQLSRRSAQPQPPPSDDPFVQLALPAPPTPTKSSSIQKASDLIDLLSGESLDVAAPATPTIPSAPAIQTSSPISPQDSVSSGNPFGPAFHAVPTSTQGSYSQQPQQFGSSIANGVSSGANVGTSFSGQSQQFAANGTSFSGQSQQQFAANGTSFPQQSFSPVGANGSAYNSMQQQPQIQQQQSQGFSFPQPQYQAQSPPAVQTGSQNSYVAPWALPREQLSPQQQAMIYGGVSSQQTQASPYGTGLSLQQQQQAAWQQMYGNYYGASSGYSQAPYNQNQQQLQQQQQYPYADQYSYQYGAGSYYQNGYGGGHQQGNNQLALVPVSSASASTASPANPADKLFEDLVDMQGLSSKFKSAGISSSLSRPSL